MLFRARQAVNKSQLSYSKNYVPKEAFFGSSQALNQEENYDKSSSIFS